MKKTILVLLFLIVSINSVQSQSLKSITGNKYFTLKETSDNVFSFRVKPVYISVQNSGNTSYYDNGFGVTFSMQYDLGKVSLFFDVNTSSIKYTEKVKEQYPPVYIDKGYQSSSAVIFGAKVYASRIPVYLKGGIGFLTDKVIPPLLNLGIGYEYKLSKTFNLFLESEVDYYGGLMEAPSRTYISVGIGTSVYIGNLYGKW